MSTPAPVPGRRAIALPSAPIEALRPTPCRRCAVLRLALILIWTLPVLAVQAMLIRLPGIGKIALARAYWRMMCHLVGLRVRVLGQPAGRGARRVVYIANHQSWLDILVVGGALRGCFVSKAEVARWPGVGTIARLGRTVFVSRSRGKTGQERDAMRDRLIGGDDLILFPEGTSADGVRVLPFRSAFFGVADMEDPPLFQPVSIVYDRLGFLPATRGTRPRFAWYGDQDFAPHAWRLLHMRGMRATLRLHAPLDPRQFESRKALAQAAGAIVAASAAALRQNRAPAEAVTCA